MLTRMILKVVFKATLPLIMMAGIASYGIYMRGGDPMAMLSKIAGSAFDSMKQTGQNATASVQALAPGGGPSARNSRVYQWTDASGATMYGSHPPDGVVARDLGVNTTPVSYTPPPQAGAAHSSYRYSTSQTTTTPSDIGLADERLPGMAGMELPVNIAPEDLGMTREQLLDLLRGGQQGR